MVKTFERLVLDGEFSITLTQCSGFGLSKDIVYSQLILEGPLAKMTLNRNLLYLHRIWDKWKLIALSANS